MFLDWRSKVSIRDQWARNHATRATKELYNRNFHSLPPDSHPGLPSFLGDKDLLPPAPKITPSSGDDEIRNPKVAIVGAGAAGLFTGLILDYLNKDNDAKAAGFSISYDILEAANRKRLGGRLFTYNFQAQDSRNPQGPHDYYDVGAMRFPENPIMDRLFALFKWLGMEKEDSVRDDTPIGSLVPYYIQNIAEDGKKKGQVNEPWCYNANTKWGDYVEITSSDRGHFDPFRINDDKKIPSSVIEQSPGKVMNDLIEPVRQALRDDVENQTTTGWDKLMEYDKYSTRQFLSLPVDSAKSTDPRFNYETIEWLETFNGGTDWYDQAHSETVLESLDFEYYNKAAQNTWRCILGGAQQLALKMEDRLAKKPDYLTRVTAINYTETDTPAMEVHFEIPTCGGGAGKDKRTYDGVFNTTTLGCLKRIDTTDTNLDYTIYQATRSLGYGPSAKVGIKFKNAWWIHDLSNDYKIKKGGLGHSDLTIRTCVYPSYNINDPADKPAVLLCSYTWQQDAERIGALMSSSSDHSQQLLHETYLKELILRDLARLHSNPDQSEDDIYKMISEKYLDHYAHDWTHDPNTAGAFAFYRPQQFSNVWNKLIHPTGNLILVGEAASPHHAWVVGALESAVHGVALWLSMRPDIQGADKALAALKKVDPDNPFIDLPPYMEQPAADWSAFLGKTSEQAFLKKRLDSLEQRRTATGANLSTRPR